MVAIQNFLQKWLFPIAQKIEQQRHLQAVKNGQLAGVMAQDAFGMGYASVVSALRTIAGMENASVVEPAYYWINAENTEDAMTQALTYK